MGAQQSQIDQCQYCGWDCATKLVARKVPVNKSGPLENVRKRRTRPTLTKTKMQKALSNTNSKRSEGPQILQLDQRRYLRWDCPSQSVGPEVPVKKKGRPLEKLREERRACAAHDQHSLNVKNKHAVVQACNLFPAWPKP